MKYGKAVLILVGLELLVGHGTVGCPEVNSAFGHLPDSAAGTDGLVVDLDVRVFFVILAEPLGIHGVREGCASARQGQTAVRQDDACEAKYGQNDTCESFHPLSPSKRFVLSQRYRVSRACVTGLLQSIQSLLIYLCFLADL